MEPIRLPAVRRKTSLAGIFFLFLLTDLSALSIDLSGIWNLKFVHCLANERRCAQNLASATGEQRVSLPANLHSNYPWFYGEVIFTRSFTYQAQGKDSVPDLLLLGSIGSVDETRINGILIGKEGQYAAGSIVSAWNKVRAYELPAGILRPGQNEIEIRVTVLDFKAGIHAGPLELTHARPVQYHLLGLRILREYIFIAIPLLLMVVVMAFLTAITYWQRDDGNGFLVAAFFTYLVHSIYFLPLPWSIEYLTFNKIQWVGRIWSVMFSALYFAKNFGFYSWRRDSLWIIFGIILSLLTIRVSTLAEFSDTVFWVHIAFLTHLFYPLFFYRKTLSGPRRIIYRRYLPQSLVVFAAYVHDTFVIGYAINTPWVFHYMSIINVVQFLDHFSFHLYMWRDRGRHDAEVDHMREKLRMAHELHDVVGSELSQIVVLSRQTSSTHERASLTELAGGALEKIRNFAHILKGETGVDTLPIIMEKLCARLKALRRYEVNYRANATKIYFESRRLEVATPNHNGDTSPSMLSPYQRMHIERMLSEWASNIIRHAHGAKRLVVGWQLRNRRVRIFVYQDTPPFHWNGKAERGGLKSLEIRAHEIGGRVACRKRFTGALWLLTLPLS